MTAKPQLDGYEEGRFFRGGQQDDPPCQETLTLMLTNQPDFRSIESVGGRVPTFEEWASLDVYARTKPAGSRFVDAARDHWPPDVDPLVYNWWTAWWDLRPDEYRRQGSRWMVTKHGVGRGPAEAACGCSLCDRPDNPGPDPQSTPELVARAQRHAAELREAGWTVERIAEAAGVSVGSASMASRGRQVGRSIAVALLRIHGEGAHP